VAPGGKGHRYGRRRMPDRRYEVQPGFRSEGKVADRTQKTKGLSTTSQAYERVESSSVMSSDRENHRVP
jgi:hypothetical protein